MYFYFDNNLISMEDDILKVIKTEDLLILLNKFKPNWPYCVQAYLFLDSYIKWLEKDPKIHGAICCPDGDFSDGTFVAIVKECTYTVYFFSLQRPCERLVNALRITKRIDWKKGPYSYCIHQDIAPECLPVLKNIGHPIEYETSMICYWISKKKAKLFDIRYPNEYYAAPLYEKDAEKINAKWAHKFDGSIHHIKNLIKMNGGLGVFEKKSNKLCCWMLISEYGALAILQTDEKHQRKKLASNLIKDMSKRRGKRDMDSFANINFKNEGSKRLFKGLGFEEINTMAYVAFKKIIKNKI